MTVLVTGARGFIGTHLVRELAMHGEHVGGLGYGGWPDHREDGVACWVNGDVDSANLDTVANQAGTPDVLFHLAGGSSVSPSFRAPLEDFRRTVESTARVFEWVRSRAPRCLVVFVSTAAVYGEGHDEAILEETPVMPGSPYGFHKAMGESICASYTHNFGVRTTVVRLFSVYGPGLRKQLLWDLCTRLMGGENPVTLGGMGSEVRDWLHVTDAVRLLALAGRITQLPFVLNGGTGIGTTVAAVAAQVAREMGRLPPLFSGAIRKGDPKSLVANIERARALGFEPKIGLTQGLAETVAWFQCQHNGHA